MKKISVACQVLVVLTVVSALAFGGEVIKGNFSDLVVSGTTTTDNLVIVNGFGAASMTEIGYLNGVTSNIQSQLNAKQTNHVNLTTLANSPVRKVFYTDDAGVLQALSFGGDNTYLGMTGTVFGFKSGTSGTGTVTSLDNTTMDNTIIGGTTPAAATFTTLATDTVSNAELDTLVGMTGTVVSALAAKAPVATPTFTGVVTTDNEVIATQFTSTAADGEHFFNVLNQATPSDVTRGNCYTDNTTLQLMCSDGATYSGYAGTVTPSSTDTFTNKTLDAAATGNILKQLKYLVYAIPTHTGTAATYDNDFKQTNFSATSTDTTENCALYASVVPDDLDTAVDMAARFKFGLGGADTAAHSYNLAYSTAADSGAEIGSWTNTVTLPFAGDGSGAAYDVETTGSPAGFTTLTNWKSGLTAGNHLLLKLCRDGADASTVSSYTISLTLRYGSTQ